MTASLASLGLGTLTLTPAFDPAVTAYTTSTTNNSNTVTATGGAGSTVSIQVNGQTHESGTPATWQEGENTVVIAAEDSTGQRVYTVTVTKGV